MSDLVASLVEIFSVQPIHDALLKKTLETTAQLSSAAKSDFVENAVKHDDGILIRKLCSITRERTLAMLTSPTKPSVELLEICLKCLINFSAEKLAAIHIVAIDMELIEMTFRSIFKACSLQKIPDEKESKLCSVVNLQSSFLANLSHYENNCDRLYEVLNGIDLTKFLIAFGKVLSLEQITRVESVERVASLFCNLSQHPPFRLAILSHIDRVLPMISYGRSAAVQKESIRLIRNCLFDENEHINLIKSHSEILTALLFPLAGSGDDLDLEDNELLPLDLQFLPPDKQRPEDPEFRRLLVEAIHQLCATKFGCDFVREQNAYIVLRELHKWEPRRELKLAVENVVDLLIKDDTHVEHENLKTVEVSEEMTAKFNEMDADYLKED